MPNSPERITLKDGLTISRLICGLWQVADLEKNGHLIDLERGADVLEACAKSGFDTFDMADHYGNAEVITGRLLARYDGSGSRPIALTKWCPEPRADDGGHRARGCPGAARAAGRGEGRSTAVPLVEVRASGLARRAARDEAALR